MTTNSAGFVPILDGGLPRTISGRAKEAISGGELVFASGANNVVSSGAKSFATSDIQFATGASGAQFVGVAMYNAGSNETLSVVRRGDIIMTANAAVTASFPVSCDGNNSVANAGSVAANLAHQRNIGRAITSAASGGHVIVELR